MPTKSPPKGRRNQGLLNSTSFPALSGTRGGEKPDGQGDAAENAGQRPNQLLIDDGSIDKPQAAPLFILGNLCPEAPYLLPVRASAKSMDMAFSLKSSSFRP